MASSKTLVLMGRHPTPGKCKTRLAKAIGSDARAARIYETLVRIVLERVREPFMTRVGYDFKFSCAALEDVEPCAALFRPGGRWDVLDSGTPRAPQVEAQVQVANLGERIVRALFSERGETTVNTRGEERMCCVAGTDIPGFGAKHVEEAFSILANGPFDVVFGPCDDGGFYCVAARSGANVEDKLEVAFDGVPWSSERTLRECVERCENVGLRVDATSLPELIDVDELDDLRRVLDDMAGEVSSSIAALCREIRNIVDVSR